MRSGSGAASAERSGARPEAGSAERLRTGSSRPSELTRLLEACGSGDGAAFNLLVPLVYDDLRRIAHRRLRAERAGHTLDTTAVVHEAYIRLAEDADSGWSDRVHFFAVCARVIRHVLIDYARRRKTAKRGGRAVRVTLQPGDANVEPHTAEFLDLEAALQDLERNDERMARVVECRFFGGLSVAETAEALGSSIRTVERDWTRAKAYLFRALSRGTPEAPVARP